MNHQANKLNIIFYSRKCPRSGMALTILQNFGLINNFKLFCVDGRLNEVPKGITQVPTMIVQNVNKPLVDNEVFEWLQAWQFMMKQKMQQQNQTRINMMKNIIANNQRNKGPLGFTSSEMNSFSDSFAINDSDMPMPQNFQNYNDSQKNLILTFPESKGTMNAREIEDKIREIEKNRNMADEHFKDSMQKKQLAKIYEEYINTGEMPK